MGLFFTQRLSYPKSIRGHKLLSNQPLFCNLFFWLLNWESWSLVKISTQMSFRVDVDVVSLLFVRKWNWNTQTVQPHHITRCVWCDDFFPTNMSPFKCLVKISQIKNWRPKLKFRTMLWTKTIIDPFFIQQKTITCKYQFWTICLTNCTRLSIFFSLF